MLTILTCFVILCFGTNSVTITHLCVEISRNNTLVELKATKCVVPQLDRGCVKKQHRLCCL